MVVNTRWNHGNFTISTHKSFLDTDMIFQFLHNESYWVKGIEQDQVIRSIEYTPLCFGLYDGQPSVNSKNQIGFARVITDFTRFAYLQDVFIVKDYRGKGLGKWLMTIITTHEDLKDIKNFMLATEDASSFYEQFGFKKIESPNRYMKKTH